MARESRLKARTGISRVRGPVLQERPRILAVIMIDVAGQQEEERDVERVDEFELKEGSGVVHIGEPLDAVTIDDENDPVGFGDVDPSQSRRPA